jgi:single-strand DNA-binding protein
MLILTLAGRLGRDAELRQTPTGKAVCNFSVAVDVRRGQEKTTTWVDCTLWEKRAEALAQYLTKGTAVAVSGEMSVREFKRRTGEAGFAVECRVSELTLLGGAQASNGASERPMESYPSTPPIQSAPATAGSEFNADIPF